MNHDEIYEDTSEDKEKEKFPYLKNDVLSTSSCYAKHSKRLEQLRKVGMKRILVSTPLANK